ncbi:MAG: MerR family transcriptional regulator [Phycisphaerales bacterium]
MIEDTPSLTIGELADGAGVALDTVRYYLRRGLLDEPGRTAHGHRRFTRRDLLRLRLIVAAKAHAMTLAEISSMLGVLDDELATCGELREVFDRAMARLREQIDRSRDSLARLESLRASCACEGALGDACRSVETLMNNHADPRDGACDPGAGGACCKEETP